MEMAGKLNSYKWVGVFFLKATVKFFLAVAVSSETVLSFLGCQ